MGCWTGPIWNHLFTSLKILSNLIFDVNNPTIQVSVAEQIPVLHRIDHSIHAMTIWVTEKCKFHVSQWVIDAVLQLLRGEVHQVLEILLLIDKHQLSFKHSNNLINVCISLRAKLLLEINDNMCKLKNTTGNCINILASECQRSAIANITLSFPPREHWLKDVTSGQKNHYVDFVLDQIMVPVLKATGEILIQELILQLICEAWIYYIYSRRIRFSPNGASALLHDFDKVRDWIIQCPFISSVNTAKLIKHEVFYMCRGVGKILTRKPKDIILIPHLLQCRKSSFTETTQEETPLPSEMFVLNQNIWLGLRKF